MIQKMFIDIEDTEDTNTNLENLIKIHKKNGTDIVIMVNFLKIKK